MKKLLLSFTILISIFQVHAQWQQTSGPTGTSVNCFLNEGETFLAGLYGKGVYRSSDDGNHWIESNTGFPVTDIVVYEFLRDGQNILAATERGIYVSSDNGISWKASYTGTTLSPYVESLMEYEGKIYAGANEGIIYSSDGGVSWTNVNAQPANLFLSSLHASGSRFFASNINNSFYSDDQGVTWEPMTNLGPACYLNSNDLILAGTAGGVYYSPYNGLVWFPATGLPSDMVHSLTSKNGVLYAGTDESGIYISYDNGKSWTAISNSDKMIGIRALAFRGNELFAGTFLKGVFKTSDNGQHWTSKNHGLIHIETPILSGNASTLFAGHNEYGIFKSADGGKMWTSAGKGIPDTYIYEIDASGNKTFAATRKGLFVSTDNGNSWLKYNNEIKDSAIYSFAQNTSHLFVGSRYAGVFRSADNGLTWTLANSGLPMGYISKLFSCNGIMFAKVQNYHYLYRSTNNGDSWSPFYNPFQWGTDKIQEKSGILFVSSGNAYFSTDQGASWISPQEGSPTEYASSFEVDGTNWYLGTSEGVYISKDQGKNWTSVSDGFPDVIGVQSLYIKGNTIYAGTASAGVWKRNLLEIATSGLENSLNEALLFPNPSSGQPILKFPSAVKAKIEILDATGKLLESVDFAGHTYLVEQSHLSNGSYFIRVTTENQSAEIHKFVIQK